MACRKVSTWSPAPHGLVERVASCLGALICMFLCFRLVFFTTGESLGTCGLHVYCTS
jgi:hypothetical protein